MGFLNISHYNSASPEKFWHILDTQIYKINIKLKHLLTNNKSLFILKQLFCHIYNFNLLKVKGNFYTNEMVYLLIFI